MIKIIIYGPTAVGKTKLSIDLALKINAEIISSDSMQVYKYLNIGTAKVKEEERKLVPHHLIDIIEPTESFNAFLFKQEAEKIIRELEKKGKNVIIVGGTALYIKALIEGLSDAPPRDENIRKKLMLKSREELFEDLKKIDPSTNIDSNNINRIIRALEVFYISGKPLSYFNQLHEKQQNEFKKYALVLDRNILYNRINERIDEMIKEGLVEEAFTIYKKYGKIEAIGYKEFVDYFKGKSSLEEVINKIKQRSRNYAKRQLTWLNKLKNFKIMDISKGKILNIVMENIEKINKI